MIVVYKKSVVTLIWSEKSAEKRKKSVVLKYERQKKAKCKENIDIQMLIVSNQENWLPEAWIRFCYVDLCHQPDFKVWVCAELSAHFFLI